ncbi:MAG TPA: cyclic pyranopterin monophosphate synthase MoaC [Candidatus Acidoferrales bacterium]|nr:cyclic pyranopterin monophosphate synthase MoaC [Candidatus Acidoferrales bacterium]
MRRFTMVDISAKDVVQREAYAVGEIHLKPSTIKRLRAGRIEKGDAVAAAEVAAIMAAKNTPNLLPFCHSIPLTTIRTSHSYTRDTLRVESYVKGVARTGVEMEALTAVSTYLLTIWDTVKQYEKDSNGQYPTTRIANVHVTKKVKQ